jgi:hypothetical protein
LTATNGCAAGTGSDTINFSVTGTITLGSSLPAIGGPLVIDGTGQGITVDGVGSYQVMMVNNGAELTLNSLTIANGAETSGGGGAGIVNNFGGTLTVTNSTFSGNSGGAIGDQSGSFSLKNTILAASSGGDCGGVGSLIDAGYNIVDDSSCNFSATGSHNNTDPKLDPAGLRNNESLGLLLVCPCGNIVRACRAWASKR